MPLAGFEPTIPVFKPAKTFHALDRAATVTSKCNSYLQLKYSEDVPDGEHKHVVVSGCPQMSTRFPSSGK
jgi:hypothetical protein